MKVKKINYDNHFTSGCETCDYGSSYISYIEIILEDNTLITIKTSQMYEYMLTESDYIELLSNNENINSFYKELFELVKYKAGQRYLMLDLTNMYITVNGKEVDIIKSCDNDKLIFNEE